MKNKWGIALLFIANFISAISQGISMIAIPWYFTTIDKMSSFGWIYMVTNILALFWVPISGTLTDKFDRKYLLMALMTFLGTVLIVVGFFGVYHGGLHWTIIAGIFMLTFLNYNLHYPTLYAFVQEMTEPQHYGRVTSIIEVQGQFATIISGACAALLLEGTIDSKMTIMGRPLSDYIVLEAWPIHNIFLLDGLTYFVGVGVLSLISYHSFFKKKEQLNGVWNQLKVGIDYLKENPYVFLFGVASYFVFVAMLIEGFYLLAPYVQHHLESGADVYAIGEIAYSLGALIAGVSIRFLFRKVKLIDSIIIMVAIGAGVFMTLYLSDNIFVFYLMGIGLGLSNAGIRIQRVTYLFSKVPNEVYGRANGIFNLVNISFRVVLLALFSLAIFQDKQVVNAFLVLSLIIICSLIVLIVNRNKLKIQ